MIRNLRPVEHEAPVVLTCTSCGHSYEPTTEDFAAGRTACPDPDCGGWTFSAQLVLPITGTRRDSRDEA